MAKPMIESMPLPLLIKWSLRFPRRFRCLVAKKDRIGIMTKYVVRENIPRNEIKRLAYIMISVF